MRQRSKKFALYLLIEGFQKAAGVFLIPVYTTYMLPEQFGILSVCLSLAGMVPVLLFLSLHEAAYFAVLKQENESKDIISVVIMAELLIFVLLIMLVLIAYIITPESYILYNISFNEYVLPSILMASLSVFQITINQILVASERTGLYVISNFSAFIFSTLLTLYLLIVKEQGVMSFIIANSLMYIVYLFIAIFMLRSHWRVTYLGSKVRAVFTFSLPLVPHTMAHWARAWIDRVLLSGVVAPSSAGIYHISTTYSGVMLPGIEAFRNTNNSRYFSLIKYPGRQSELSSILSVSLGCFSFAALFLSVFSEELIALLTSNAYHEAYQCVPILLSAHLMYLVYINTVVVLFDAVKTQKIAAITISTSAVSVLVSYFMIKYLGLYGAAISSLITNMILALIIYRECQKTVRLPWPIIKSLIFALLPTSLAFVDTDNVVLKLVMLALAGILISLTCINDIKTIVKHAN